MTISIDDNDNSRHFYFKNFRGKTGGNVSLTTSTAVSSAIVANWLDILIIKDDAEVLAFVEVGTAPVATSSGYPISLGQTYRVPWVTGDKIAGIMLAGTAELYYCPVQ